MRPSRTTTPGHRKMVAYFDLGNAGPNNFDEASHGTHTAGSVDGDKPPVRHVAGRRRHGAGGGARPPEPRGHGRRASRVFPPTTTSSSARRTGRAARAPCRPRAPTPATSPTTGTTSRPRTRARTTTRTGCIAPVIDDGTAVKIDQFVWDHEDMVIVVSAGNAGPDPGSVGSPSIAKNNFSSGASANGRQPMVSIDSMANFSSHGPTGDGRFGPDLATPGQVVVSAKGGTDRRLPHRPGHLDVGAGADRLLRRSPASTSRTATGRPDGKGFAGGAPNTSRRHNPSAALVKARLVNGAERMRGWYTGDDGVAARRVRRPVALGGPGLRPGQPRQLPLLLQRPDEQLVPGHLARRTAEAFAVGRRCPLVHVIKVQPGAPLDVTLAWTDAPDLLPAGTPGAGQQPQPDGHGPRRHLRREQLQQPDEPGRGRRRDATGRRRRRQRELHRAGADRESRRRELHDHRHGSSDRDGHGRGSRSPQAAGSPHQDETFTPGPAAAGGRAPARRRSRTRASSRPAATRP